jgi:solute:Na+ symporter, SSS family
MTLLDYSVVALFFLLMVGIGVVSFRRIHASSDFFVAGGKVPWWLGGISHHVSGYSGVVFVAYAAVAYEHGFTLYVWWALSITLACVGGAFLIAPRWSRLRSTLRIESPTEYLAMRYNLPAQQLMAWSGVLLKLFDVGAKWASIGILLHGFTGLPISVGIWVSGGISLLYITIGGLWADLYTDLAQFVVQIVAGIVLFVAVAAHLGGSGSVLGIWDQLPDGHSDFFNGPYSPGFFAAFIVIAFLSYNGGTWNLAARYMAAPSGESARRAALLSGALYALWPLILFFPMWAAPLLLPNLADPSQSYAQLVREFLPAGLVGLVLAAMFANTMSMTTSDANTISAVITRDILPVASPRFRRLSRVGSLRLARVATLVFTLATLVIAIEAERFGGVLSLIISWFGALVGPVAIPMLLGLLPMFKRAGPSAAIASILGGFTAFVVVRYAVEVGPALSLGAPVFSAGAIFLLMTILARKKPVPPQVEELMVGLSAGHGRGVESAAS